jgi:hypothetical protein
MKLINIMTYVIYIIYKIIVNLIVYVTFPWYNAKCKHKQTKIGTQIKPS